jgi:hypothetical protein
MSISITIPNRATRVIASFAALLLSAGCSAVSGGIKSPENAPSGPSALAGGEKIGTVTVSLVEEKLTPKVTEVAMLYEVPRILDNRVREQLMARGMSSEGPL